MRDHLGFLVWITRLGRAVVAAHNAQGGYRASAVGADCRHDLQKQLWCDPVTAVCEPLPLALVGHV